MTTLSLPTSAARRAARSRLAAFAGLAAFTAFAAACSLDEEVPAEVAVEAPPTSSTQQAGSAYRPLAFARVAGSGAVLAGFSYINSAVTATRTAVGKYTVSFAGLGASGSYYGVRGNVQLTAEGTDANHCHVLDWVSATNAVTVRVECFSPAASAPAADTAFSVLYLRDTIWPTTPGAQATRSAYTRVRASGILSSENYNSSGVHNTVTWTSPGIAVVTIPGVATRNASLMVTPHASGGIGAATCAVVNWAGGQATIQCRSHTGELTSATFSLLFSTSGPAVEQQSGHALFNGSALEPDTVGAVGKVAGCSPAAISQTRTDSLIHLTLTGDLGSWDDSPFVRATFATKLGAAGYCKLEALTISGAAPTSTATSSIRCYSSRGTAVAYPGIWYTHTTSAPSGPC